MCFYIYLDEEKQIYKIGKRGNSLKMNPKKRPEVFGDLATDTQDQLLQAAEKHKINTFSPALQDQQQSSQ